MEVRNIGALMEFWKTHADAEWPLRRWLAILNSAAWRTPLDCRATFRSADPVRLPDGRTVTVFNVKGNEYRLVAAVLYPRQLVVILKIMTHAEYARDAWKDML